MNQHSQIEHSMGEIALDDLLGGLLAGDNVVRVGDRADLHDRIETAFLDTVGAFRRRAAAAGRRSRMIEEEA